MRTQAAVLAHAGGAVALTGRFGLGVVQAGDQGEVIPQTPVRRQVDAALLVHDAAAAAVAVEGRNGQAAIPGGQVLRQGGAQCVAVVGLLAGAGPGGHGAHDELVLTTEQLKGTLGARIHQVLAGHIGVGRRPDRQAVTGALVWRAIHIDHAPPLLVVLVGGLHLGRPAIVELVVQGQEADRGVGVPVGPVRRCAGGAGVIRPAAVGVVQRQRPPHHAGGPVVLAREARRQQRAGSDIGLHHAIGHPLAEVIAVQVGVGVLAGHHHPASHTAVGCQRGGDIGVQTHIVPGARGQPDTGLEVRGGALAHEVHRRRRVAGGGQQTGRPVDHIDAIEHRGVQVAILQTEGHGQPHTIELEVRDVEAAGRVVGAVGLHLFHVDAGGAGQGRVHVAEVKVIQLAAGDDRNRLWRFTHRQIQTQGGIAASAGGRGIRPLRLAGDRHGGQGGVGGRRGAGGWSRHGCRLGTGAGQAELQGDGQRHGDRRRQGGT